MRYKIFFICIGFLLVIGLLIFINPNQLFSKMILRAAGEYKPPQYETPSSILSELNDAGTYYDRLYRLSDFSAMEDFKEKKLFQIPFVHIYNRDKKLMTIASGDECKWSLMDFVSKKDTSKLVAQDSLMYYFVMEKLEPIDIKTDQDTFEYYILAGWANFAPKLSIRLFNQTNDMMNNMNDKICLSYINLDYQKEWEAELDSPKAVSNK